MMLDLQKIVNPIKKADFIEGFKVRAKRASTENFTGRYIHGKIYSRETVTFFCFQPTKFRGFDLVQNLFLVK